ncbi:MAG: hypothetical protein JWP28_296 [Phenylobacterium sp.]|nr:hypothetical protein [Phenylobacterium sp.]
MSEGACPIAAEPQPCGCKCADERAERHLTTLQELAEIGMDLARDVRAKALDPAPAEPACADFGLMFSRIARAVRQTLALEARLAEDRDARDRRTQAEHARRRGLQRKAVVRQVVEQAIGAEADGTDREDLLGDLHERFEYEDELRFADRPISEHVARICRDLGVTPDWSLWADEDWALEEANLLSPTRSERTEGGERGDAEPSPAAPDPAMTHPPPIWPPSEP